MTTFSDIAPPGLSAGQLRRIGRRDIIPASVKPGQIAQDIIKNSAVSVTTFSFNDGVVTTVTARSTSSVDSDIRLAAVPFEIAFFNAATLAAIDPGTNQIPFDTTTGNFDVYGPFAMPNYTKNGTRFISTTGTFFATDGNDLVFKTAVRNSSSGAQSVTALVQLRLIQGRGGGSS